MSILTPRLTTVTTKRHLRLLKGCSMIYSPPRPDQIVTFGGERVSVIDGAPSLESVAVSLGRIPRFAGHTRTWYPVLAHVLCCAAYVEDRYGIHALLHDAAESCVNDVPRPMKP